LETAKEELQSTNEELTTLNEELETRNSELAVVNNDLQNVMASVNIPSLSSDVTCASAASPPLPKNCST
jgi:two-component system CheB/CheR fusion protein